MNRGSRHGIDRDEWSVRAREFAKRGEELPHSKLTESDVRAIRRSTDTYAALARRHNVHVNTIWKVKSYDSWRHVT